MGPAWGGALALALGCKTDSKKKVNQPTLNVSPEEQKILTEAPFSTPVPPSDPDYYEDRQVLPVEQQISQQNVVTLHTEDDPHLQIMKYWICEAKYADCTAGKCETHCFPRPSKPGTSTGGVEVVPNLSPGSYVMKARYCGHLKGKGSQLMCSRTPLSEAFTISQYNRNPDLATALQRFYRNQQALMEECQAAYAATEAFANSSAAETPVKARAKNVERLGVGTVCDAFTTGTVDKLRDMASEGEPAEAEPAEPEESEEKKDESEEPGSRGTKIGLLALGTAGGAAGTALLIWGATQANALEGELAFYQRQSRQLDKDLKQSQKAWEKWRGSKDAEKAKQYFQGAAREKIRNLQNQAKMIDRQKQELKRKLDAFERKGADGKNLLETLAAVVEQDKNQPATVRRSLAAAKEQYSAAVIVTKQTAADMKLMTDLRVLAIGQDTRHFDVKIRAAEERLTRIDGEIRALNPDLPTNLTFKRAERRRARAELQRWQRAKARRTGKSSGSYAAAEARMKDLLNNLNGRRQDFSPGVWDTLRTLKQDIAMQTGLRNPVVPVELRGVGDATPNPRLENYRVLALDLLNRYIDAPPTPQKLGIGTRMYEPDLRAKRYKMATKIFVDSNVGFQFLSQQDLQGRPSLYQRLMSDLTGAQQQATRQMQKAADEIASARRVLQGKSKGAAAELANQTALFQKLQARSVELDLNLQLNARQIEAQKLAFKQWFRNTNAWEAREIPRVNEAAIRAQLDDAGRLANDALSKARLKQWGGLGVLVGAAVGVVLVNQLTLAGDPEQAFLAEIAERELNVAALLAEREEIMEAIVLAK